MASTYVILRSVDAAATYFKAGLVYFRTRVSDWEKWVGGTDMPPYQHEIDAEQWAILVEDDNGG